MCFSLSKGVSRSAWGGIIPVSVFSRISECLLPALGNNLSVSSPLQAGSSSVSVLLRATSSSGIHTVYYILDPCRLVVSH